jgi:hypothetical protein
VRPSTCTVRLDLQIFKRTRSPTTDSGGEQLIERNGTDAGLSCEVMRRLRGRTGDRPDEVKTRRLLIGVTAAVRELRSLRQITSLLPTL